MKNKRILSILTCFLITFSFLSISSLAQERISQTIIIITWIIGIPSIAVGFLAIYNILKAAKIYGGKLGSGLSKIFIFIITVALIEIIMGIIIALYTKNIQIPNYLHIVYAIFGLLISFLFLSGSRGVYNSTK